MKAIVYYRYGSPDVLQHQEVDDPVVPDGSVLVRVRASSANPHDWHLMRGEPYVIRLVSGLRAPRHNGLGIDLAHVEEPARVRDHQLVDLFVREAALRNAGRTLPRWTGSCAA